MTVAGGLCREPLQARSSSWRVAVLAACFCLTLLAASLAGAAQPGVSQARAAGKVTLYPLPAVVRSTHYQVTLNGHRTPVVQAANEYYLLNFDTTGPVDVTVTADNPHFWDRGVEIEPDRLGIRPVRHGATLRFRIPGPEKITISRPGDHFASADMLFLFANGPETSGIGPKTPGVRYYGPGVYHESIDANSGDTIYLAGGAVLFGSLNIWQVHDVHVLGRGMIIYDGPQTPLTDTGWMHKRNWHAIVMDNAHNIEIDGITTVVRSRTWQVQMKDSRNIGFYNVKEIAGTPGDANGDGMDWLGGGSTTVRDGFIRAADDVYALQGNWGGYTEEAMKTPGHDVTDITISNSVVSTSISNTIRVAWPQKTFNSAHFHMSDMDVVATGYGSCKAPFAFFELWADPDGHGTHNDYSFRNIRLDNWYSLFQIRYPNPYVHDVKFSGAWAMDGPAMEPSVLLGDVQGVALKDVPQVEGRPVQVLQGAEAPTIEPGDTSFDYTAGALRPDRAITFTASQSEEPGRRFEWLFGDGTTAQGRVVHHSFKDAKGTLLDGSGRFRVLLHVTGADGVQSWASQPVVLAEKPLAVPPQAQADAAGSSQQVAVPADGGYTFWVLSRNPITVSLDGQPPVASPKAIPAACGEAGNAVQPVELSAVLRQGTHSLAISGADASSAMVIWAGAGFAASATARSAMTVPKDGSVLRQALRRELLAARAALSPEYRAEASCRIFAQLRNILQACGARIVGAYLPIRQEPDSLPWIEAFAADGGTIALPVVVDRAQPLAFCSWTPGNPLQQGALGTRHPAAHATDGAAVTPDVLVIPLVGFDAAGFRLGYGGGFYDRTLADASHATTTVIGVGFEQSRVPTIYPQPHDRPMHRILTEAADRTWSGQDRRAEQVFVHRPVG